MAISEEIKKLFKELSHKETAFFTLEGTSISVNIFDHGSKMALVTPVYEGGNYIPPSVRRCVNQKQLFRPSFIKTHLSIDEDNYQISLHYEGHTYALNDLKFKDLVEEFSWLADEWRQFLDEHDKNDLVYVRAK